MKIHRTITVEDALTGKQIIAVTDLIPLEQALIGFANPEEMTRQLNAGIPQHFVNLAAGIRICGRLAPQVPQNALRSPPVDHPLVGATGHA